MKFKLVLILLLLSAFIISCSKNDYNSPDSEVEVKTNIIGTWESVAEKYEKYDKNKKLVNSENYEHKDAEDKETYIFHADKTGTVKSFEEWSTEKFTYSTQGNTLAVLFKDETELGGFEFELEFEFSIKNNKLSLIIAEETEEGIEKGIVELIRK